MSGDAFTAEQGDGDVIPPLPSAMAKLITRFFQRFTVGSLTLELPSGERIVRRGESAGPDGIVKLNDWRVLRRLVTRGDLGFAEGYMEGDWTTPDLVALVSWASANEKALKPAWVGSFVQRVSDRWRHMTRANTKRGSRRNIAAHYDLGNAFYAEWLDVGMNYSSALYEKAGISLEDAQTAKLDRVIALLDAPRGSTVLEIGCGWGSLAERLVVERNCRVTGLTLSRQQLDYARNRLHAVDVAEESQILFQDYRDTNGTFDRIVSIEMFEAAGEQYWPGYFDKIRNCLAPGGTAVLQVITIDEARFADYRKRPDFIQHYIFPGGMLPTVTRLKDLIRTAGLTLDHIELFGQSYAKTLAAWRDRFLNAWPTMAEHRPGGERFRNMWDYYLSYCEAGFAQGVVNVGLYRLRRG